jgi:hypothetical protein
MAVTPAALIQPKFASTTATNEYAAQSRVIVDKFTATNVGSGAVALTLWVVPVAGTAGNDNRIVSTRLIAPNETFIVAEMNGHVLEASASIWAQAAAGSSLVLYASGRVVA